MMEITFWGTRGSLATPDPEMTRMGGNTSCVEVRGDDGTVLVLDAGTGIRRLGRKLEGRLSRVDVLLSHLHMDHIQGLGFFAPLFEADVERHIWGPPSVTQNLAVRLSRYLSPPLFPVHLRDVPGRLQIHDLTGEDLRIGEFEVRVAFVCHPNPTVGYRVTDGRSVLTYLPDHEPALGDSELSRPSAWISGLSLARGSDVLIHDSQYTATEYPDHVGWGHSSMRQAFKFAHLAGAGTLVAFHHDPSHTDDQVDRIIERTCEEAHPTFTVLPAMEGTTLAPEGGRIRLLKQ
jgi:ribonuclease BN (tRNA processing enzyme)